MHFYTTPSLWPEAADIAAELGCRAALLSEESGGDAFDEAFSKPWSRLRAAYPDLPIPLACLAGTIELRGQADVADDLGEQDARALFRCLQRRGFIAGDPGKAPEPLCAATELTAMALVQVPVGGIVVYAAALGDHQKTGDVIAWLIDPAAENPDTARQAVVSPTDGLLLARSAPRYVRAGDCLAKVVGKAPLPGRLPGQLMMN
jgi:predicted deacylase